MVHCGLDPLFHNAAAQMPKSPRRIVCVARLSPEKGLVILIEAARLLAAQGVDFELVLAGDGELRPQLEAEVARYQLTNKFRFTGWLTGEQVRDEILASRALILPSFAEGLPVVLMEAMALRRPVISTFISGIPELVRTGIDGWLVPAGDPAALADAMRRCLEAPDDEIARMGETARERVLQRHDVNTEAAKLQKLFLMAAREQKDAAGAALPYSPAQMF